MLCYEDSNDKILTLLSLNLGPAFIYIYIVIYLYIPEFKHILKCSLFLIILLHICFMKFLWLFGAHSFIVSDFSRVTMIFVYYGLTLNIGVLAGNIYLNLVLNSIVEISVILFAVIGVDRFGRKKLTFFFMATSGITGMLTLLPYLYASKGKNISFLCYQSAEKFGSVKCLKFWNRILSRNKLIYYYFCLKSNLFIKYKQWNKFNKIIKLAINIKFRNLEGTRKRNVRWTYTATHF